MLLLFLSQFFIVSFLLNFLWEVTQMIFYSPIGMGGDFRDLGFFIRAHWLVSLKDALIILGLYILVALVLKNWHWGRHFTRRRIVLLWGIALVWAAALEYYHVHIVRDWSYLASMPLIPIINIGLWPVLQMLILPVAAIWLTRRNLFS